VYKEKNITKDACVYVCKWFFFFLYLLCLGSSSGAVAAAAAAAVVAAYFCAYNRHSYNREKKNLSSKRLLHNIYICISTNMRTIIGLIAAFIFSYTPSFALLYSLFLAEFHGFAIIPINSFYLNKNQHIQ
jgi:putative flippase GtrA